MAQKSATQIESVEHVPASEHGRGLPRIASILEDRRRHIESDLAEAQRLKEASDAAIAAHEKALPEARGRAQTLANETREKAAAAAELRRKEVDAKLGAHIAEAEKIIAATASRRSSTKRAGSRPKRRPCSRNISASSRRPSARRKPSSPAPKPRP